MEIKKRIINIKNPITGEWEAIPALQGAKGDTGAKGKDGLTTSIKVNGSTYTHSNGLITLPNYPSLTGYATEDYVNNAVDSSVAYGTCSTEAATSEKIVVVENENWKLEVGNIIMVKFLISNSASNVTINVNNTGAYPLWASASEYTGTSTNYTGYANRTFTYVFNGTHWVWISNGTYPSSTTNVSLGQGYTTCSTAAATKAKTAALSSYSLSTGGIVAIKFTYDVPAGATLNINSKGAKAIYHKGAAITDGIIKAGDTATFIYSSRYHLISIDRDETFSGDYNDLTNKPSIPTKVSQLTNDIGYLTSIPSEYVTDSELEGKDYATKEFVKSEIAKIDTTVDIVDSIEEMTDTNKQYVHSATNTWWKYKNVTIPAGSVLPNVNNAINWSTTEVVLNKRLNSSRAEVDAPGCATFYFTFNDEMKNILNTIDPVWIRMKGCSMYPTSGNSTSTKVVTWNSAGSGGINSTPSSQVLMYEENGNGISSAPYSSSYFNYNDNKTAPVTATKFGYINTTVSDNSTNKKHTTYTCAIDGKLALSLIVNFASTTAITEADLEDVYITFNEPIVSYEEITVEGWYDTGIVYNAGDDSTVVDLGVRVSELEDRVEELENRPVGGGSTSTETTSSTLPSYWKDRIDEISPKIETLQKEYGMDAFQFLWASDIHSVPGSSPNDTTHIGAISRYMMDKHNIPFFMTSGDIMSQGSHSKVEYVWNEYDKLNDMLSPIRNDEFLAVKGNHDGAWGSPVDGVYYLNNIGTKELFNAFYRRQTLDRNRVFGKDGTYFYVDCPNVRFYMLNAHTDGDGSENDDGSAVYNPMKHFVFGNEQLNWIADSLLTVQDGQKVIFMAHPPTTYCLDGTIFANMIAAYKNRNNYEGSVNITGQYWGTDEKYSKVSVNKDFSNAKGDLVGYFHGHIHKDTISVDGYYPVVSITTAGGDLRDEYLTNGTLTRVKGTATETAIDLVTVTSDYIYCTRIGSGYDRKFNRATNEVTIDYDSAFIPEEDTENEPIEGFSTDLLQSYDIKLNQRWSYSSDSYVNTNGTLTFSVPFADINGRTIKIIGFETNTGGTSTWYAYDSSGTAMGRIADIDDGTIWISDALIDNGDGTYDITADKEIFISYSTAEPLTDTPDTIYISMYVGDSAITSTDGLRMLVSDIEDSGLTQGDITSEVGYALDKRYSTSDGSIKDSTKQTLALDKIQVEPGDVIRVKGINYPDTAGEPVIATYGEDGSYVVGTNLCTANIGQVSNTKVYFDFEDDLLTVTVAENSACRYIGISGYYTEPVLYRVTRNSEVDTTNLVVPNSTNTTDTSIWVNGYRFSSSELVAEAGTSVSNKIPIQKGDIIKISGVTLRENQDRLCVNINRADTGEEGQILGYFNNGALVGSVKVMSYKGYEDGVYTFFIESEYTGTINYFRFAMATPTDFSKVKVIREEGNNVNLFNINGDGYTAWDGSKMYTNWMPYTTAETGSKLSTVYHIKGDTPYKFQFKYSSGTETSLIYCTNANSLANVTSDYSDEVTLFQHDFSDGYGTGFMIRFEFRTDCASNLIVQADSEIYD